MWNVQVNFVFISVLVGTVVWTNDNVKTIVGVRFLLTVNDTWGDCITTVATQFVKPNLTLNKSPKITVGQCDQGPLQYQIRSPGDDNCSYTIDLVFHSSVIEDASPPTCKLSWNGTYLVPKAPKSQKWDPHQDILPYCFTMDSREGYHMTAYWFHVLEWNFDGDAPY